MEVGDEESLRVQGVNNHPPYVRKRKAEQLVGDMRKRAKHLVHTSINISIRRVLRPPFLMFSLRPTDILWQDGRRLQCATHSHLPTILLLVY